MNTKIKNTLKTTITTLLAIFVVAGTVQAIGTLTPSETAGDDTQYTTNDIFNKLTDFSTTTSAGSGSMTVPESVTASFNTLSEIYAQLEAEEVDLVPENIADGVTIFGVTGTNTGPALQWSTETADQTWTQATLRCSLLTEGGVQEGTWRMPTIHELGGAIQEDLNDGVGDIFDSNTIYWSGTEYGVNDAWSFGTGYNYVSKTNAYSVRCVR